MPKGVQSDISDLIVNTDVMADLFGFTRQGINQLAQEGVLEKNAPGRFSLLQNVKQYVEFVRTGLKPNEEEASDKYWKEKTLHEKAKREMTELKLAKLKNHLHDAADIEMVMTGMLVTFRNRCLAIPGKLAPLITVQSNPGNVQESYKKK